MPTVRTVTIKPAGGGDFTKLITWNSARKRNLVTPDEIERVECHSGGDLGPTNVFGWTMDAAHYVEIVAAAGHQHQGRWDLSKAYLVAGVNGFNVTDAGSVWLRVRGLQIQHNSTLASVYGFRSAASGFMGTVEQCIIRRTGTGANQYGISVTGNAVVRNNIVWDYIGNGCVGYLALGSVPKFLNNTAYRCRRGFNFNYGAPYSRNCLAAGCVDGFYSVVGNHDYNASDIPGDAPGPNSRNGVVFTFVDPDNGDFHLALADQGALRHGLNLSALFGFDDDIDGRTRASVWDIGADQHPETYSGLAGLSAVAAVDADGARLSATVLRGAFAPVTGMPGAHRVRTDLDGAFALSSGLPAVFGPDSAHPAEFRAATTMPGEFDLVTEVTQ